MTIIECNKQLRALTDAHEAYRISMADYRFQRKQMLDNLDKNMNGIDPEVIAANAVSPIPDDNVLPNNEDAVLASDDNDKTQPYFSAKLGKCFNFLKGNNDR